MCRLAVGNAATDSMDWVRTSGHQPLLAAGGAWRVKPEIGMRR
jgi:hypothetical protein